MPTKNIFFDVSINKFLDFKINISRKFARDFKEMIEELKNLIFISTKTLNFRKSLLNLLDKYISVHIIIKIISVVK